VTARLEEIRETSSEAIWVIFERSSATTPTKPHSLLCAGTHVDLAVGIVYELSNDLEGCD